MLIDPAVSRFRRPLWLDAFGIPLALGGLDCGDSRSTDSAAAASKRASVIHTGGSLPALGATEENGASMPKPREFFHEGLGSERFRVGLAWLLATPRSGVPDHC
jgi:hypothetical protein